MKQVFLDTNIVVYALLAGDPKQPVAMDLLRSQPVIGIQTLNECASVMSRKLRWDWKSITKVLADIRAAARDVVPVDLGVHTTGLGIAVRYKLAIYYAMIVAAALSAGCELLYSEDMHHGLVVDGRLTIENPFLSR